MVITSDAVAMDAMVEIEGTVMHLLTSNHNVYLMGSWCNLKIESLDRRVQGRPLRLAFRFHGV